MQKNQPGDKLNKKLSPLMPQYCQQWFWFLGSSKPNLRITLWNHQCQRCFEPHQSLIQQHPSDKKSVRKILWNTEHCSQNSISLIKSFWTKQKYLTLNSTQHCRTYPLTHKSPTQEANNNINLHNSKGSKFMLHNMPLWMWMINN